MSSRIARPGMAALAVLLAAIGAPILTLGALRSYTQPPTASTTQFGSGWRALPPARAPGQGRLPSPPTLPRSIPKSLDIPAIGVHTDLTRLGLNSDGTVKVPPLDKDAPAGWYRHSVTPGEVGSAVILGHVDSARDGPAVFYRLGTLQPGDRISVRRADRSTATFVVDAVQLVSKADFPTDEVYGEADSPVLHLVTCGGRFDRRHGVYRQNLIVTASMRQ